MAGENAAYRPKGQPHPLAGIACGHMLRSGDKQIVCTLPKGHEGYHEGPLIEATVEGVLDELRGDYGR